MPGVNPSSQLAGRRLPQEPVRACVTPCSKVAGRRVTTIEGLAGADGKIHGGLYTIIIDSIFGLAVFTALEAVKPIATINLRTDYLGEALPGAGEAR